MKTLVLFYSTYGHIYKMAEAIAEGAREVEGNEVTLKQVPETLPKELLDQIGATQAQQAFGHIPVAHPEELVEYDAIIFGTPTRYGNLCGQMQAFMDATGDSLRTRIWSDVPPACDSGGCRLRFRLLACGSTDRRS